MGEVRPCTAPHRPALPHRVLSELVRPPVLKVHSAWKFGRRLGVQTLAKMLHPHSEPIARLSGDSGLRSLSVLLSLVLGAVEIHLEAVSDRLFSDEVHGVQVSEIR